MLNTVAYVGFNEFVPLYRQGLCPILLCVLLEFSDAPLRGSFRGPHDDLFDLIHESSLVIVSKGQIPRIDHLSLENSGKVEGLEILLEFLLDLDALDVKDRLHRHIHRLRWWLVQNIFQDTIK